jgi:DNA-binding IclR family transcriptional regulator
MSTVATRPGAPALERGIQILRLLGEHGAFSLEELSRRLELPKSSVLRLTETLQQLGLVERRADKKFCALAVLLPNSAEEERRRLLISEWLTERAEETGCTIEWYEWNRTHSALEIVQRREPPTGDVIVRARQGFTRVLTEELEAVSQVALAFGRISPSSTHWQWKLAESGMVQEPVVDAAMILRGVKQIGFGLDSNCNIHGVRRLAFPFMAGANLIAVAAVALTFRPDGEKALLSMADALKKPAGALQKHLDGLLPSNPRQICP